MIFDLFFQNNASKQIFKVLGAMDVGENPLYLKFTNIEMPAEMPDGEYTYYVFANGYRDVEYELDVVLGDSKVIINGKKYSFNSLRPLKGLMRKGNVKNGPPNDMVYVEPQKNNVWYYKG